jgi:hypothetical protein
MAAKTLNVGLIGYGFMGRTHSNAYRKVTHFFDVPFQPVLKVVCGLVEAEARAFAAQWGYESFTTNWREVVERKDVDIVDICVPNNVHAEIAIAAAKAGKMIICEKPLALNSAQALNIIATAQHIVGDTEKYRKAKEQLLEWGYPENTLRIKIVFPYYTHFDDRLAFLGYFPLLNYETDPRLRAMYMRSLQRGWEAKRFENQTWFNYIYGALTGNACQNKEAVQHLRDDPLECINYRFTNSHRHDLQVPKGYTNYVTDTRSLGPREQGVRRWDRDPLELDGGGDHSILDPSSYLDAYWMGRYYGFIVPLQR